MWQTVGGPGSVMPLKQRHCETKRNLMTVTTGKVVWRPVSGFRLNGVTSLRRNRLLFKQSLSVYERVLLKFTEHTRDGSGFTQISQIKTHYVTVHSGATLCYSYHHFNFSPSSKIFKLKQETRVSV
jgi:hypothetical protein